MNKIPIKPKPPIRFVTMRSMTRPEIYIVDLDFDERDYSMRKSDRDESILYTLPLDRWTEEQAEYLADYLN